VPQIEQVAIDKLIPYINNARTHSQHQVAQVAASIREFGFTNPVLVDKDNGIIAGHGRVQAAQKLEMTEVPCLRLDYLTEAQKKAYILADNKLALNAGWDEELLALELAELGDMGFDLELTGFELDEIDELLGEEDENPYTNKVTIPVYEPTGEKPAISEMFDDSKAIKLMAEIDATDLPDDEKRFLKAAAWRHVVFDFETIANYYAHSSVDCQELFEKSALVIIDLNKAIENGYAVLSDKISDQYTNERENEESD